MAKYLADENVPAEVVNALRQSGYDLAWLKEISPGASDSEVLRLAFAEERILLTFDKDFGDLAFRQGVKATCGVILLRPRPRSPEYLAEFALATLAQSIAWEGQFAVAREGRLRVVPLPN